MAATVGALRVVLGANTANFEAGMKRARREATSSATAIQRSLGGIKAGFAGLAAGLVSGAVVGGLVQVTKRALDYAASLGEISEQLGVTTDALQTFRFIATQTGISQDEMDNSLGRLSDSIAEAGQGTKAQAEAFNELGINVKTANGDLKSTDRIVREMADAFTKLEAPQERVRIARDLMGRSGGKFITALSGGAKAIDEWTEAAREAGVVIASEDIQKADQLADDLAALNAQLSARIAGTVAANADSIRQLASELTSLAGAAIDAAAEYLNFLKTIGGGSAGRGAFITGIPGLGLSGIPGAIRGAMTSSGEVGVGGGFGTSVAGDLGTPKPFVPRGATGLNRIAGGGGRKGGGRSAESIAAELERKRVDVLQETYERERAISDAKADELRAQQDLLTDFVERGRIEEQLIDIEADQRNAELALAVEIDKSYGSVAQRLVEYNEQLRILKKQKLAQEQELDRQDDFNRLQDVDFGIQRELLDTRAALAETAAERRRVELQILDVAYQQRQADIDRLAASKDFADQEEARRRQLALDAQRAADTAAVRQGTRGPLEDFQASLPMTAEKMNEALQLVATDGLRALEDGILSVIDGTKSLGEAFRDMASQIISELLRIQIQRAILGPLSNALGGLLGVAGGGILPGDITGMMAANPGVFASGGFTGVGPRNRLAGFVHAGEYVFDADATRRIGISNLEAIRKGALQSANDRMRGGDTFNMPINIPPGMTPKQARESGAQFAAGFQSRIAQAKRQGF